MRVLSRTWQMLLKGIAEVQGSRPPARGRRDGAGAHRLCRRSADARRGDPLARRQWRAPRARRRARQRRRAHGGERAVACRAALRGAADARPPRGGPRAALAPAAQPAGDPVVRRAEPEPTLPPMAIGRFEDLIALAAQKRDLGVKLALERDVRLVRCEDGRLEIALGAERGQDAGQRSRAQVLAMDQPALDGGGLGRTRASRRSNRRTMRARPSSRPACAPTRWCRRCWRAFPAPRSSTCARSRRCRRRCRRAIPRSRCRNCRPMTMVLPSAAMARDDGRSFRTSAVENARERPISQEHRWRWQIFWA